MTALTTSDGMALAPVLSIDGALDDRWLDALTEMRLELAVRRIGRLELRFADPGYALTRSGRATVGSEVKVAARGSDPRSRETGMFTGTITGASLEVSEGGSPELVVVAQDDAHRAARSSRARTYLNQSYSQIVKSVLQGSGVATVTIASDPALTSPQPYVLQADSDLGFIDEIAERIGCDWTVVDGRFHLWTSWTPSGRTQTVGGPVSLTVGAELRDFSVSVSSDAVDEVTVRGWDRVNQRVVEGKGTLSRRGVPDGLMSAFRPQGGGAPAKRLSAASRPVDPKDAEVLAQAHVWRTGTVLARGRADCDPRIHPGVLVDVAGVGPASGAYFVQEVEHLYRPHSGMQTRFVAGDRPAPQTTDGTLAPARRSFGRSDLVVARVTDVDDERDLGRVKVLFESLDDRVTSDWARVAFLGGGASRGAVFLPEVGDEVLVGFEDGDPRRPVVLGGLFGTRDKIPATLREGTSITRRRLTSRLGHVVELADGRTDQDKHILLALGGSSRPTHRVRLGQDALDIVVPDGVPLRLASGASTIELDGSGAVSVTGTTVEVKADRRLELTSPKVVIKGDDVAVSGLKAEVKASATLKLEAGGQTTIKGGMVQIN